MSSSRFNARSIGAPAALGAVLLLFCAGNARAGTDDSGPFSALGNAIGVTSNDDAAKIDYRERPKLVVPPDRKALPEPRAEGDSRPPSFPVDTGSPRRQGARAVSGKPNSPDEPARENLTQPPYGYRLPTKDLSQVKDTDKKETSWWNPMGYFGSSGDNSKPASSGASAQTSPGASAPASPGASAPTSPGPSALASSAGSQPTAQKPETGWWNPMGYLPSFGSK